MSQKRIIQKQSMIEPEKAWWQFDTSTWLLIAGLVVFNIGVFIRPGLLDFIFALIKRLVDFRLWPWYYFIFLAIVVAFSIRWFKIFSAEEDDFFADENPAEIKAFLTFSILTTVLIVLYVILRQTPAFDLMYDSLYLWLGQGVSSLTAFFSFTLIIICIGSVIGTAWIWFTNIRMD